MHFYNFVTFYWKGFFSTHDHLTAAHGQKSKIAQSVSKMGRAHFPEHFWMKGIISWLCFGRKFPLCDHPSIHSTRCFFPGKYGNLKQLQHCTDYSAQCKFCWIFVVNFYSASWGLFCRLCNATCIFDGRNSPAQP